jgi:hypothetical protein
LYYATGFFPAEGGDRPISGDRYGDDPAGVETGIFIDADAGGTFLEMAELLKVLLGRHKLWCGLFGVCSIFDFYYGECRTTI